MGSDNGGEFDVTKTPGYNGYVVRDLNAYLIAFSTVFLGARLYVRTFLTKALGLDDLMAAIAYVRGWFSSSAVRRGAGNR